MSAIVVAPIKGHPLITCLSAAQLAGVACARCHRPVTSAHAFVPLADTATLGHLGVHTSLFVYWPSCEVV